MMSSDIYVDEKKRLELKNISLASRLSQTVLHFLTVLLFILLSLVSLFSTVEFRKFLCYCAFNVTSYIKQKKKKCTDWETKWPDILFNLQLIQPF